MRADRIAVQSCGCVELCTVELQWAGVWWCTGRVVETQGAERSSLSMTCGLPGGCVEARVMERLYDSKGRDNRAPTPGKHVASAEVPRLR